MPRKPNRPTPSLSRTVWAEIKKNMYINGMEYSDIAPLLGFVDSQPFLRRDKDPEILRICEVEQIFRAMGLRLEIKVVDAKS